MCSRATARLQHKELLCLPASKSSSVGLEGVFVLPLSLAQLSSPEEWVVRTKKTAIGGVNKLRKVNALYPQVITPFVGCSASPRRQRSSPGRAPRELNWPLCRPEGLAVGNPYGRWFVSLSLLHLGATGVGGTGCVPKSSRGLLPRAEQDIGVLLAAPQGDWRHGPQLQPGHSPQRCPAPASNARRVPKHTQACPEGTGAPPVATTPRWKGDKGSSRQNKAVTKQRHFGSVCSEAESS